MQAGLPSPPLSRGSSLVHKSYGPQACFGTFRCLIQPRNEDVPKYRKPLKQQQVSRVFSKEHSVFKDWKEDTHSTLAKCFEYDQAHWKLSRFIKDAAEQDKVERVLEKHYEKLKRIFINEACRSRFPNIVGLAYSDYCIQCQVCDEKLNLAGLDRQFTAATFQTVKVETNPQDALQRFEFVEVIVRLAQDKFYTPKLAATMAEAVSRILLENFFEYGDYKEWQTFRDRELWTLDLNDIFEANLDLLKKLYKKYLAPMKPRMSERDCLSLLMKDSEVQLNEKDALYCFGMAKMTVVQENEQAAKYQEITFVELLEMLGRAADLKYRGTPLAGEPLAVKLERLLDLIFPIMLHQERKEVNILEDEMSVSDDDY